MTIITVEKPFVNQEAGYFAHSRQKDEYFLDFFYEFLIDK